MSILLSCEANFRLIKNIIWALDENMIPIPGFKNVKQAIENAKVMEFGLLTPEQMTQVGKILDAGE